VKFDIAHTWDGVAVAPDAVVRVQWGAQTVVVEVDAPYHGDPAPSVGAGPVDGLWEYEVVELFVVGRDGTYTELELGPHGHHLLLQLSAVRVVAAKMLPVAFDAQIAGERWRGRAELPRDQFPAHPVSVNAYRIHGQGEQRRYLAHAPVPGPQPDFHRLSCFAPWPTP
jgi:hypothetical protein